MANTCMTAEKEKQKARTANKGVVSSQVSFMRSRFLTGLHIRTMKLFWDPRESEWLMKLQSNYTLSMYVSAGYSYTALHEKGFTMSVLRATTY